MRNIARCAALLVVAATAVPVLAQTKPSADALLRRSATRDRVDASYEHTFDDDPIHTIANSTRSLVIVGHGKGARAGLVRPRVAFVPELLKSVEAL